MNKVELVGRLTAAPELRHVGANQTSNCRVTVAVKRPGKDAGSDFIQCNVWGSSAEFLYNYATKGSMVAIAGSWQTGSYEAEGRKIYTNECNVREVEILDSRKAAPATEAQGAASSAAPEVEDFVLGNEDLPFQSLTKL